MEKRSNLDCEHVLTEQLLSGYTSMGVGGPAQYLCEPSSPDELSNLLRLIKKEKLPFCLLGGGTNLIFADSGFQGAVIRFSRMNWIERLDETTLYVGAGLSTKTLINYCIENGLGNIEFLAGIPGAIGGAFCMNSGSMGGSMQDIVRKVRICGFNGSFHEMEYEQIDFGYRHTYFGGGAVTGVYLQFEKKNPALISSRIKDNLERRKKTQPVGVRTCGSIFKNPDGHYAGELIERLGFKGFSIGGAVVSTVHANFIENRGQATSNDIFKIIQEVGSAVSSKLGIDLQLEVILKVSRGERV